MPRHDGRNDNQIRPLTLERGYTSAAAGSVLVRAGNTTVLCTASISDKVPPWLAGKGKGWVTAEYNMLPGSTSPRKERDRKKVDGRSTEIQRLIGRSLRAGIDMQRLGERLITVDCDVLLADGGTRTASITGGWVALVDAIASIRDEEGNLCFPPEILAAGERPESKSPIIESIAAISAGLVKGRPVVDLDYPEDSNAEVDMNLVMTGSGRFVEVQGGGEGATFTADELAELTKLGSAAIEEVTRLQRSVLGAAWTA